MATCKLCTQELTIELDPESFDEASSSAVGASQTAPDDLMLLSCNCHFHWQCLLDESSKIATDSQCPSCHRSILSTGPAASTTNTGFPPSQQPQVLTRYHNEGGIQEDLDILPLIAEEAYLDSNPAARPARAFMTMCAEGDVAGIMELLTAIDEDPDEGDMSPSELIRYQDPLDCQKTGFHVAIEKNQQEVVWLLLWLASALQTHVFPEEVTQAAQMLEAERKFTQGLDIRVIRDEQHRTAEEIAGSMQPIWAGILAAGILRA